MFPLGARVTVSEPRPKSVAGVLPTSDEMDEILDQNIELCDPLIKEGSLTGIDLTSAYTRDVVGAYYVGNAPSGLNMGNNVCCHGSKVQVTTYRTYWMERHGARHPDNFNERYGHYPRIYCREGGRTTRVHTMRGPARHGLGRAGGHHGWDSTRDLFGFALASFKHNFQGLLGAFSSRPKLPCSDSWHLPNLVHSRRVEQIERRYRARIVEPPTAVPPASYSYSFNLPTPMAVFIVGTKCPIETRAFVEIWNRRKENVTDPFEVKFPEDETETVITLRSALPPISSGYFNINPVNSEMTVGYVNTIPPILLK